MTILVFIWFFICIYFAMNFDIFLYELNQTMYDWLLLPAHTLDPIRQIASNWDAYSQGIFYGTFLFGVLLVGSLNSKPIFDKQQYR